MIQATSYFRPDTRFRNILTKKKKNVYNLTLNEIYCQILNDDYMQWSLINSLFAKKKEKKWNGNPFVFFFAKKVIPKYSGWTKSTSHIAENIQYEYIARLLMATIFDEKQKIKKNNKTTTKFWDTTESDLRKCPPIRTWIRSMYFCFYVGISLVRERECRIWIFKTLSEVITKLGRCMHSQNEGHRKEEEIKEQSWLEYICMNIH